jgi:phage-related protein
MLYFVYADKRECMYEAIFYSDSNGNEPIKDFLDDLEHKSTTDKNARINRNKIIAYIKLLEKHGTAIGEPVVKHLRDDIWELRPLKNRILFASYKGNIYLLMHHFMKKTQKTPQSEIKQAERLLKDYRERNKV